MCWWAHKRVMWDSGLQEMHAMLQLSIPQHMRVNFLAHNNRIHTSHLQPCIYMPEPQIKKLTMPSVSHLPTWAEAQALWVLGPIPTCQRYPLFFTVVSAEKSRTQSSMKPDEAVRYLGKEQLKWQLYLGWGFFWFPVQYLFKVSLQTWSPTEGSCILTSDFAKTMSSKDHRMPTFFPLSEWEKSTPTPLTPGEKVHGRKTIAVSVRAKSQGAISVCLLGSLMILYDFWSGTRIPRNCNVSITTDTNNKFSFEIHATVCTKEIRYVIFFQQTLMYTSDSFALTQSTFLKDFHSISAFETFLWSCLSQNHSHCAWQIYSLIIKSL